MKSQNAVVSSQQTACVTGQDSKPLPLGERLLCAVVFPSVPLYGITFLLVMKYLSSLPSFVPVGPDSGPGVLYVLMYIFGVAISCLLFAGPAAIGLLLPAFFSWRYWHTAILGGLASNAVGIAMGIGNVVLLFNLVAE